FAAHKITVNIIDHFIAVDVAVIVRCGNTLRMIIEEARHKTAHNKIVRLKSLMYWRLMMYTTCNRFKIVNAKCEWITTSIPTDNIKRMMTIVNVIHTAFLFCADHIVASFIERHKVERRTNIAFAIR